MIMRIPGCKSMDEISADGQPAGSERASCGTLEKLRSGAQLPPDFLEKRWVQIFRRVFGPIHPGYLICTLLLLFFLSFFFAIRLLEWVFILLPMSSFCILALAVGIVAHLVGTEYRVPDRRVPFEEIEKDFEARDILQGIVSLVALASFLALGALFFGLVGAFAALAFFLLGILALFPYLVVTSRVHPCTYCNRPAVFRKFRGRWTCVVCGNPS